MSCFFSRFTFVEIEDVFLRVGFRQQTGKHPIRIQVGAAQAFFGLLICTIDSIIYQRMGSKIVKRVKRVPGLGLWGLPRQRRGYRLQVTGLHGYRLQGYRGQGGKGVDSGQWTVGRGDGGRTSEIGEKSKMISGKMMGME
jgi:hypothetical protein